jgi:hypothetical protein
LIDSHQDNWRVGNWARPDQSRHAASLAAFTPDASNSVAASLPPFPPLWINEVEPDNLTGITNSAGQHAPWIELYNPSTNRFLDRPLFGRQLHQPGQLGLPLTGAVISPGQFLVIFADGQTNLSTFEPTAHQLRPGGSSGSLALSRFSTASPRCSIMSITPICRPTGPTVRCPTARVLCAAVLFSPPPAPATTTAARRRLVHRLQHRRFHLHAEL